VEGVPGAAPPTAAPVALVAAVYPQISGAAQFHTSLLAALRRRGPVEAISWRRLYPPVVHRREARDHSPLARPGEPATELLDWVDPRTWRAAVRAIADAHATAMIVPWLHPVMTPPYHYLLSRPPAAVRRVVICHNVVPHDPVRGAAAMTRAILSRADVLVTHAPHMRAEIAALGLADTPIVDAFLPRFAADEFAPAPPAKAIAAERERLGSPDLLLLLFGAVRPYKGADLAVDALARVDPSLDVRLVIAGVCWDGGASLRAQIARLRLAHAVEIRDRFVAHDEAALLFCAADASLLPYRSATQSAVVQQSFAYGTPVIATTVGGLPAAVRHGRDGLLCEPGDPDAIARAIEELAGRRAALAAGVVAGDDACSYDRYVALIHEALGRLPAARR
jgi:glycosyltransferase involved in cell wall biosynthesis